MTSRFEHVFVLNVVSTDRPGIVAAVSAAVDSLGGNIEACSQTVVQGYFTLIMIVSLPEPMEPDQLAAGVRDSKSLGPEFQVVARGVVPEQHYAAAEKTDRFVITAFGKDRPGIVRRFAQYMAGRDVNIVDLYGDRSGEDFVLISELEVPARWDIRMLQADLEKTGKEMGFTVKLQHEDIFVATNQLRLTRSPPGCSTENAPSAP